MSKNRVFALIGACVAAGVIGVFVALSIMHVWYDHATFHKLIELLNAQAQQQMQQQGAAPVPTKP